jgi:hypothetical protein
LYSISFAPDVKVIPPIFGHQILICVNRAHYKKARLVFGKERLYNPQRASRHFPLGLFACVKHL